MLDVGFSELLLIAVVAIIFIGPKDLPVVIRHLVKFWRELRDISAGLKAQMKEVLDEAGLDELHKDLTTTTIIDLEGTPQKAYDVKELSKLETPKPKTGEVE